ncbi:hypothetical protein SELMODRAFT_412486 [Selaginella moellendorffii]|uniref:phosphoglycerate dehydrogenase n=1 Tax=Selaginella moellendorffii TaxID=88036 RepID=D8RLM4_SELML|nr:hypothetical protein SELMODRAFT_412486 [Selaginella moellendorffii]
MNEKQRDATEFPHHHNKILKRTAKLRPSGFHNHALARPSSAVKDVTPRPTVLVAEKLGEAGLDLLRKVANVDCSYNLSPKELQAKISLCDAVIVRSATKVTNEVFEAANGRLKVVGRAGVGIDNVNLQAATDKSCLVVNAPTANAVAAAEHAIALLAALARNVAQANASVKSGKWQRSKYTGVSLVDKTIAVMGFGKVGSEVARRAKGLGMHVIAHDPYAPADRARAIGVEIVGFDEALARADFISLHMPLTATTKLLRRGGVIDEAALIKALDNGTVAQAAHDVFEQEPPAKDNKVVQHENVIVTPHLGASTVEAQEGVAVEIAEAVVGALRGELSATAVNAPMVSSKVLTELTGREAGKASSWGGVKDVIISYTSARSPDDLDTRLLRAMIVKGLVEPVSDAFINLVNADYVAKQRGIRISEERHPAEGTGTQAQPLESIAVKISKVLDRSLRRWKGGGGGGGQDQERASTPLAGGSAGDHRESWRAAGRRERERELHERGEDFVRKQAVMAIGVDEEPSKEVLHRIGAIPAVEEFVFLNITGITGRSSLKRRE